jgi:hypothetical protein
MRKVQFEFTDETYTAINNLADITGARSMSAVIRDALKTYAWLIDEQRAGRKILSQDPKTHETRELVTLAVPANSMLVSGAGR